MSPTVVAFLFSVGSGGWVYSKMARRSGSGNLTPAIVVTAITTAILFLVSDIFFHSISK